MKRSRLLTKRDAVRLLDQQMWLFGQDIRRPSGNLLIRYGFTRQSRPDGTRGTSMYTLETGQDAQLVLWGFGLWLGRADHGSVFLRRFEFQPRWSAQTRLAIPVWEPDDVPKSRLPRGAASEIACRGLLTELCRWLAEYERWAVREVGLDDREAQVRSWMKKGLPAKELPHAWQRLAAQGI